MNNADISAPQKLNITFPDGKVASFSTEDNGFSIAASISSSMKKNAIAIKIDGKIVDLSTTLTADCAIEIITKDSAEGLEIIRHDTAHVLAQAIKEIYPSAQIAIGPVIKHGFYYDIDCKTAISEHDLGKIEKKMQEIIKRNVKFERKVISKSDALKYFTAQNEHYKVEIIQNLPDDAEITLYHQGDFADLCAGPHGPSTGNIKAFKLLKIAGAYWRGDSNNTMLQRIYGTAWANKADLEQHLHMLSEAEKRDHRKIGKEMNLFHFQKEAPGSVFWHHNGFILFNTLISYLRKKQQDADYREIATPEIMDLSLWQASGHWDKFQENMLIANSHKESAYAFKPMNCPGGLQVLRDEGPQSYKELPLKIAEFGKVYRYEASGALHGLMRARSFTQDDAHIYCLPEQLEEEIQKICLFIFDVYKDFGFSQYKVKFADRPEKRIGDDATWDASEKAITSALSNLNIEYELNKGEGAFYGPKIEIHLEDSLAREWQLGTVQVDLNMPKRLNAPYIDQDGAKQYPVMIHRAIFGSLERFIAILIENYAGRFPLWLAPMQVAILNINERNSEYARKIHQQLQKRDVRTIIDFNRDTIQYKIRKHTLSKIPIIVIVGDAEESNNTVSIRWHGSEFEGKSDNMNLEEFIQDVTSCVQKP